MGLREEAAADMAEIVADGFVWSTTVTDPAGLSAPVIGRSNDIGQVIDMNTGAMISGRSVTAFFTISTLLAAGFTTIPVAIADTTSKPWRVDFLDLRGNSHTFKVVASHPDRTLDVVSCELEVYTP